jgi:acyl-CoA reductase-like NAD-dependent aldehyde dehydrogenase
MPTTAKTNDLDTFYDETVESHKIYLGKLQAAFDKQCDKVGESAKAKLAEVPEENLEARQKILLDEQEQLNQTLAELKKVVTKANGDVRKKLEEIENQRSDAMMDLEAELAQIENPKKK